MLIIDAHTHIGTKDSHHSVEEQIKTEKACGISGALFSPTPCGATEDDLDQGNSLALELFEKYPDFLYPAVEVNPLFPGRSLYWLEAFWERGLRLCGEWLGYVCKIEYDDPSWAKYFEFAAEHNMVVQLHNSPSVPAVAKRYPQITMVGAHLYSEVLEKIVEFPNVYVDISGMHGGLFEDSLTEALRLFGEDRLLFGTDMPGYDPLAFVVRSQRDFPDGALQKLGSENLRHIFKEHGAVFPPFEKME